jgi:predicted transposase/invertase (TIGR01784 family)
LAEPGQLVRIYLDEIPPPPPDQFEIGILELIAAKPDNTLEKARAMVPRLRASKQPKQFQRMVLPSIETVIVHQFPNWRRQELEAMVQVTDVSQTRVFQEALEEGMVKGREKGVASVALRLLKMGRPIAEIAQATDLTPAQIRKLSRKSQK